MPLKNIVVFVDPSRAGAARARYAVKLAHRHGAHLIGIFIAPTGWHIDPAESYVRGHDAIRRLIERHREEEVAASETAGQTFRLATEREGISFEFRIIRESDAAEHTQLHSLHADLVIVGHPWPGGLPSDWSAETLLLETGVPALVLPDNWKSETVAEHVLLAWNASREARRAITDSLPLLIAARSVSVIVVDPEKNSRHGEEPGADVGLYLSRHGVTVTVEQIRSNGSRVASVILNHAKQNDFDLIVLGAYSHSRSREVIFGGVTQSLLNRGHIPILFAH